MAKQNAFLAKQEAKCRAMCEAQRRFTIQQCADMMLIAAHDEMGFGPERLHRLMTAYQTAFAEYADMTVRDGKDDPSIEYTKAQVDGKLRQIYGDYFIPWEERYAW